MTEDERADLDDCALRGAKAAVSESAQVLRWHDDADEVQERCMSQSRILLTASRDTIAETNSRLQQQPWRR
jgi:hypothetical protein